MLLVTPANADANAIRKDKAASQVDTLLDGRPQKIANDDVRNVFPSEMPVD